jgi:hypothetical protein
MDASLDEGPPRERRQYFPPRGDVVHVSPVGQSAFALQSWKSPAAHDGWHVAEAEPPPPPRPPNVKQHTSPFEQLAEFVHESAAPPWH